MEQVKQEVLTFLDKCEILKRGKFIMATAGIKDILKSIVNSPALYELFQTVTENFDYVAAKRSSFVTTSQGFFQKSTLTLPAQIGDRLAFIFCLLVEFDNNTLNFTDFLQRFFPEDGSCFASFHSFCDKVIVSLEDIVKDVFKEELEYTEQTAQQPQPAYADEASAQAAQKLSAISLLIAQEKDAVNNLTISDIDKENAAVILDELEAALKEGRVNSAEAALCGYSFFIRCNNNFSQFINLLTAEIE